MGKLMRRLGLSRQKARPSPPKARPPPPTGGAGAGARGQAEAPARPVAAEGAALAPEGAALAPEGGCGGARGVRQGGLQAALDDARAEHAGKRLTLWFMDEARFGQKGRVCRRWFTRGQRPQGLRDPADTS